jgi:hypothetical protein
MTLDGVVSNTQLAVTDTSHELNAIGINGDDGYLYGMRYNRYSTGPATCGFNNTQLYRYDAVGGSDSLGSIAPPPGGSVTTAIGMVAASNQYVFFARDAANALMIGMIYRIDTLHAGNSILAAEYHYVINNCSGKSYADFAINPSNGKLYSYGTYMDTMMKGTVLELDPGTLTISCVGTPATGVFTHTSDNFGGIMFGNDGYMYGVNIYSKKFYKIDPGTGNVTYISTIPAGTSQIRADLGSCAYGLNALVLPVRLISFTGSREEGGAARLQWVTEPGAYKSFEVQKSSNGREFTASATVHIPASHTTDGKAVYNWSDERDAMYYRLAMMEGGKTVYSAVVDLHRKVVVSGSAPPSVYPNPSTGRLTLNIPQAHAYATATVYNAVGAAVHHSNLSGNSTETIDLSYLPAGLYTVRLLVEGTATTHRVVLNK